MKKLIIPLQIIYERHKLVALIWIACVGMGSILGIIGLYASTQNPQVIVDNLRSGSIYTAIISLSIGFIATPIIDFLVSKEKPKNESSTCDLTYQRVALVFGIAFVFLFSIFFFMGSQSVSCSTFHNNTQWVLFAVIIFLGLYLFSLDIVQKLDDKDPRLKALCYDFAQQLENDAHTEIVNVEKNSKSSVSTSQGTVAI